MIVGKKGIEGSPKEIHDFSVDYGFDYKNIFGFGCKPKLIWIIVPGVLFFTISVLIKTWINLGSTVKNIFIIADLFLALWFTSSIHLRFDTKFVTTWTAIFSLIVISVCSGFFGLKEIIMALIEKL
jgi:O-antigen ligase